jgi:hypothetical protein
MKYKINDIVVLKTLEELKTEFPHELSHAIYIFNCRDSPRFVVQDTMLCFLGQETVIKGINEAGLRLSFLSSHGFRWPLSFIKREEDDFIKALIIIRKEIRNEK